MSISRVLRLLLLVLLMVASARPGSAQTSSFGFTSGPIPLCDTSTFTANVNGIGILTPPGMGWGGEAYLDQLTINITTDHPQTLQIFLTSPEGTTLLLSEFNGAGGQNYTNTTFAMWGWNNITTGNAPFTGTWTPQGGSLDVFDYENGDGTWIITVIDTACANGGTGPGGGWTPGWFDGGGSGGFTVNFYWPPPPCGGWIGDEYANLCPGTSVDLLAGNATMFNWMTWTVYDQNGNILSDPSSVSTAGWYNLEAIDPWDGCWWYGTYQVSEMAEVVLGPDQTVSQCSGAGAVDLTALFSGTGAAYYTWTLDGVPIPQTTAAAAMVSGVYEVVGINAGNCNDTAQVTLTIGSAAVLGADQTVSTCAGAIVDLTSLYTTTGYTSEWSFGGAVLSTPNTATDAGDYMLVVSTPEGCTDTAMVTLLADVPPALGGDQAVELCNNSSLDLTALYTTTGLTASWSYLAAPVLTPAAVYQGGTYELVVSTGGGCTDTALVVVTLNLSPALGPDLIDTTCEDEALDLTGFFPTAGLTTSWTIAGVAVPDPTSVLDAGAYTLVATDINNCTDTAQTTVVVMPLPVLGPDQSLTSCDGAGVDLTTLFATGTNTTAWTEGGDPVADPTSVTNAGEYILTVTSVDLCTASASVTLALDPAPALGADETASICAGSIFDLAAAYFTAGLTEEWTFGGGTVPDPSGVSVAGDYQLVVSNSVGCTDTAVVSLSVSPNPALGADLTFTLCPWQTVDLSSVFPLAGMTVTYTLNGIPVSEPTAVYEAGTYTVTATDVNGCSDVAEALVMNMECLCEADFLEEARCIQEPVQFTLLADSMVVGAHWSFSGGAASGSTETDPLVRFNAEGDVLVTLEATLTCGVVLVERTIRLQDCTDSCSVWIPSSFTPDNDGINDTWSGTSECAAEDYSVQVFDRWGEIVFSTKDPLIRWDGTFHGKALPSGVYAYRVEYRLPYQKNREVAGSITLVR